MMKVNWISVDSRQLLFYSAIVSTVVLKMVGLEKLTLGSFPLELRLAPILLPLAMVFRRAGIVAMTLGCFSAHLLTSSPPLEIFAAASSAFLGSYFAYLIVKNVFTTTRLIFGCFLITAIWTLIMSLEWAAASGLPWIYTFDLMLARLFFSINLAGFILALAAKKAFGKSFLR